MAGALNAEEFLKICSFLKAEFTTQPKAIRLAAPSKQVPAAAKGTLRSSTLTAMKRLIPPTPRKPGEAPLKDEPEALPDDLTDEQLIDMVAMDAFRTTKADLPKETPSWVQDFDELLARAGDAASTPRVEDVDALLRAQQSKSLVIETAPPADAPAPAQDAPAAEDSSQAGRRALGAPLRESAVFPRP